MKAGSRKKSLTLQRRQYLKILLGVGTYAILGQLTHRIRNPMLPHASLALNMVIPVVMGYWGGASVGAIVGALGTLLNFSIKLPLYGPDLYELAAVLPHTLMGAVAGCKKLRGGRIGTALTILIGHILNLAAFLSTGLLEFDSLQPSNFWLGLLAEIMVDIILIVLLMTGLERLQGRLVKPAWYYLGWLRFLMLGTLHFLLIVVLLLGYQRGIPYIDYFLILAVVFVALTLGFLEAWLGALLISVWIGRDVVRDGLLMEAREVIFILILNAMALIIGDVVSNLRRQRRLNHLRLEELQEAYTVLSQADHLKDQMIQNISHELRTPLSMILGYTELLTDGTWGALTEAQQEAAQVIRRNAQRLADIVEKVTVLDRVDGGKMTRHPTSIEALAKNLLTSWQKKPQARAYDLQLEIEGSIPPVNGDARYLKLAIEALLDNAVKFSPEESTIIARVWTENNRVHFSVQDTGIGIAEEDQALLFERFYQVDGTMTRQFSGLGTGLALVKEVAYVHGGDVWVESKIDAGSTFGFWIPLNRTVSVWQKGTSVFT